MNSTNGQQEQWEMQTTYTATEDALLSSLILVTKYFHHPFSGEALTAGLPLEDNCLTPDLFVRAADRAGLAARVSKKELPHITNLSLPAVLLLKKKQACVLTKVEDNGTCHILQPDAGGGENRIPLEELELDYTGHIIFVRPAYRFDQRTEIGQAPKPKHWFWGVVQKALPIYSEILVASFLINMFAVVSPLFVMNVYDRVVPNAAYETLWVLAIGISIVYIFDLIMKGLRGYFIDAASKKIDAKISANIYEQILGVTMGARPKSVGTMANMVHSFEAFRDFITSTTMTILIDIPFVIIFLLVIYALAGNLAFVPMAMIPVVLTVGFVVQMSLNNLIQQSYRFSAEKQATLIETLSNVETIKSMAAESPMQRKWERVVCMGAIINNKIKTLSANAVNLASFFQQLAWLGVIIFGVYKISSGELTMGGLIACSILTSRALAPMSQVASLLTRYHQSVTSLKTINNLMEMPVERPHGKTPLSRGKLEGNVEFKDVSFQYEGTETPVLKEINFKINSGERVGIIGKVGSGKTTLEKLITGLYTVNQGTILVDDIEIGQYDPTELRKQIGYVPQDIDLFYGTIKDNIVIGAPYVSDEAIIRAANLSGISRFIKNHPQGFDMIIEERGKNLSGGQRQAIAIARALLLDPPILLLDEPSSAMDDQTDAMFKQKLAEILPGKTLILVTHRAPMLSLVDRLIILDEGRVVAEGPKDKILSSLKGAKAARQENGK